nr:triose-phosphate isomerase [Sphingobacterium daejeonense]
MAEKVDAALKHGLKPIFCIGETQSEREAGSYFDVIKNQLSKALFHLDCYCIWKYCVGL